MAFRQRLVSEFIGDRIFYREVAVVALPIILQQLIATSMMFLDSIMIGQIDAQAMASIAVSNKFFLILMTFLMAIAGGAGIFITQYYGAKDHDKGQGLLVLAAIGCLAAAAVFVLLLALAPEFLLSLFVSDKVTIEYGRQFLTIFKFSLLPFALSVAIMHSLRSVGQTRITFVVSSAAVVLNTLLNYLLIFGNFGMPEMGVQGAGLATLLARLVEAALYILVLARSRYYFNLDVSEITLISKHLIKRVVLKTIPLAGNELAWSVSTALVFKGYALADEQSIASIAVTDAINNFIFVIFAGFAVATAIMVGARLGAGEFEQARRNSHRILAMALAIGVLGGAVGIGLSGAIAGLYQISDQLREMTTTLIIIQAAMYPVVALNFNFFITFRTGGDMKALILMDAAFMAVLVVPLALILGAATSLPLPIVFLSVQLTEVIKIFVGIYFYRKRKWLVNLTS